MRKWFALIHFVIPIHQDNNYNWEAKCYFENYFIAAQEPYCQQFSQSNCQRRFPIKKAENFKCNNMFQQRRFLSCGLSRDILLCFVLLWVSKGILKPLHTVLVTVGHKQLVKSLGSNKIWIVLCLRKRVENPTKILLVCMMPIPWESPLRLCLPGRSDL